MTSGGPPGRVANRPSSTSARATRKKGRSSNSALGPGPCAAWMPTAATRSTSATRSMERNGTLPTRPSGRGQEHPRLQAAFRQRREPHEASHLADKCGRAAHGAGIGLQQPVLLLRWERARLCDREHEEVPAGLALTSAEEDRLALA